MKTITRAIATAILALASCSKASNEGMSLGSGDGGPHMGTGGDSGIPMMGDGGGGSTTLTSLRIAPSDPTITVVNGQPETLELQLYAADSTGAEQQVMSSMIWRAPDDRIGTFLDERQPRYTANGDRAGTAAIEAHYQGLTAMTTVKVTLSVLHTEGGAPSNADSLFTGPVSTDPASVPSAVYPENGVMIPKNLVPMLLQWNAPATLDVFRAELAGPMVTAAIYTGAHEAKLASADWVKLLEATAPGKLELTIAGTASTDPSHTVYVSPPIEIDVSEALMRGTIYYWALNIGRILRIRPGAETYEDFFTPPPQADTGSTCAGCHTLSRDGSKMAFEYYGGWQTQGIINVVAPDPPVIPPGVFAGNFSAFSPAGDRLLAVINGALSIHDSATGAAIEDLPAGVAATHPAWSPDGATIAYAAQVPGQNMGDVDFFQSDLTVFREVAGVRMGPTILVPNDGLANTYPSFSPDSRWLAFGRGPYSRSHTAFDAANPSALSPGDLFLIPTDGSALPVRLDRASHGGQAFLPAFSPFSGSGVLWLAFFSRRDYGNVTAGSARRQIWVTAIDVNPQPGSDPSHAAFWLPAQDATTQNMSAYWAPDPCHAEGGACTLDEDCCGGSVCRPDGNGGRSCVNRDHACRELGEACASDSECCVHEGELISCMQTAAGPACTKMDL